MSDETLRPDPQAQVLQVVLELRRDLAKMRAEHQGERASMTKQLREFDGRITNLERAVARVSESQGVVDLDVRRLRQQVSDQQTLARSINLASAFTVPPLVSDLAHKGAAFSESDKERAPSSHYGQ